MTETEQLKKRIDELSAESAYRGHLFVKAKDEADSLRLLAESYRAKLQKILDIGNLATQGKWDATDEMKNVAYQALAGEEKE